MFYIVELNLVLQVRIFTFSVGQHNYDKGPIQWMACSNKGTVQFITNIYTEYSYQFITILVLNQVSLKTRLELGSDYSDFNLVQGWYETILNIQEGWGSDNKLMWVLEGGKWL